MTVRHSLLALDGQGASVDTQVMVVLAVPQVPLSIHPMSFAAWDSLTVQAEVVQGGPIDPPWTMRRSRNVPRRRRPG